MECDLCGKYVGLGKRIEYEGSWLCQDCHVAVVANLAADEQPVELTDEDEVVESAQDELFDRVPCPRCGFMLEEWRTRCHKCGAVAGKPVEQRPDRAGPLECGSCGTPVTQAQAVCNTCGVQLPGESTNEELKTLTMQVAEPVDRSTSAYPDAKQTSQSAFVIILKIIGWTVGVLVLILLSLFLLCLTKFGLR